MEKRNYVKPVSNNFDIRTNKFMVGSGLVYEEEDTNNTFAAVLDECFFVRVNGKSKVTNEEIAGYFKAKMTNGTYPTLHLKVDIDPTQGDADCTDGYIKNFKSCYVSYDGSNFYVTGSSEDAERANLNY